MNIMKGSGDTGIDNQYLFFVQNEEYVEMKALPHTDYKRYPTVMEKLKERQKGIKL